MSQSEPAPVPDAESTRRETASLAILVDAGNVVQRAIEKSLFPLGLGVAQWRILSLAAAGLP